MSETHVEERPAAVPLLRLDLNDQAYDRLRERLLTRDFAPGERLSLQALADELGVSRSPVQHALTRLVEDGLVLTTRRGHVVRPITPDLMRETHDARLAFELFAAELIVARGPVDLTRLRETCRATIAAVEGEEMVDKAAYLRANEAFHECIVELSGNGVILGMYRKLAVHRLMERALLALPFTQAGGSTREHAAIVDGLAATDLAAAQAAIRANAETGKRLGLQALEEFGGVL